MSMLLFVASGRTLAARGREEWISGQSVTDEDQASMEAVEPGRVARLLADGILTQSQDVLSAAEAEALLKKGGAA